SVGVDDKNSESEPRDHPGFSTSDERLLGERGGTPQLRLPRQAGSPFLWLTSFFCLISCENDARDGLWFCRGVLSAFHRSSGCRQRTPRKHRLAGPFWIERGGRADRKANRCSRHEPLRVAPSAVARRAGSDSTHLVSRFGTAREGTGA